MSKGVDFSKQRRDYATYLPAISGFFVTQLAKLEQDPNYANRPCPKGLDRGFGPLNFLDPDGYYHYDVGLFSAGHAELNLAKADAAEPMVQKRDRNKTTIVGDSGGFQIATGVLKLDWEDALDPNSKAREELCEKILRWLEHTADWSMTLDIPAFAAEPPLNARTGLTKFQDTLDISIHNLNYFMKNRVPGATKFLNVLSGSSEENSKQWFEAVHKYSDPDQVEAMGFERNRTLEGYAFAGINMKNMYSVLWLILKLREKNLLEGKDWIHFLGNGKLNWACYLTSIQRMLRKHDNPHVTLSFDAASPYVATAYGQCYTHNGFIPKRFGYFMSRAIDNKELKGSDMPMPFKGPIMDRLKVGDICAYGPGDLNKNGKEGSTSWDTLSYALYMAHNVHNHIDAVLEANRLVDVEKYRTAVTYKDWHKGRKFAEVSPYVPYQILLFDSFVQDVLDPGCKDPFALLEEHKDFLSSLSFGVREENLFDQLFDTNDVDEESDLMNDSNNAIMDENFDPEA